MNKIKIPKWNKAVIKVGSSIVAPDGKGISSQYTLAIANFIIQNHSLGREIILVSSGAVAAGLATQQNVKTKYNRSIPEKQALAAIGQSLLMESWSRFFDFGSGPRKRVRKHESGFGRAWLGGVLLVGHDASAPLLVITPGR